MNKMCHLASSVLHRRKAGWQAETRDADGHLCRTHVPFDTDEEVLWFVREALEFGETITIWPRPATSPTLPVGGRDE